MLFLKKLLGAKAEPKQPRKQQESNGLSNLQAIIRELQQPPRDARDIPRRVGLCRQALAILPKVGN